MGSVSKKIMGGVPSRTRHDYWNGLIPWITVKDFSCFNPKSASEYITRKGLDESSASLIPKRTLIISTRMALGKVSIYDIDVAINQDLKAIFIYSNYNEHFFEKCIAL